MAAPSKVKIYNMALAYLGVTAITSVSEGSVSANRVGNFYDRVRGQLLEKFPWNFAKKMMALSQTTEPATGDYDYAYTLPSDCLKPLSTNQDADYRIFGNTLLISYDDSELTDDDDLLYLTYIYQIEDESLYSELFVKLFSLALAVELAPQFAVSTGKIEVLEAKHLDAMAEAETMDWAQDNENTINAFEPDEDSWITARG